MKKFIWVILLVILFVGGFLRFYNFTQIPPGLYIDEISIGVNAYDLLTTGKDQYGVMHPLYFKSLGDYKVPGYIYLVAGSMGIFGKNEFAIRFPSALAGTLTIGILFLLVRELLRKSKATQKHADIIGLFAAGLLAITPWHIHFSRGGFEAVVALFLFLTGIYIGLKFWQSNKLWQLLFVVFLFLGAMYTYDSYRVIVPLTAICGFILGFRDKNKRITMVIGFACLILLALPLFIFSLTGNGQTRFFQTSAFVENPYSGLQKYAADLIIFVRNYFSYFSLTYLFRFGDQINRHQVNDMGILYLWQLPFLLSGIYFLVKTANTKLRIVILLLFGIGIVPASIARPSPHTLRFLLGVIPYTMVTVLGIYQLFLLKKPWVKYVFIAAAIFAVIEFGYYLNYYYVNYPKEALIDWGASCKETAQMAQNLAKNYTYIVVDKNTDCAPEYFAFFAPKIKVMYVPASWFRPDSWQGHILYIRPYYGDPHATNVVKTVYLPNINHDIFVQMYSL